KKSASLLSRGLSKLLNSSGTDSWGKEILDTYGEKYGVKVSLSPNENMSLVSANSKGGEIEPMLQLLYMYMAEINKDTIAFNTWKSNKQLELKNHRPDKNNNPKDIFSLVDRDLFAIVENNNSDKRFLRGLSIK